MANEHTAREVIAEAGIAATDETLSMAKKILDASEKIGEAAKETAGYVVDLANAYKNALKNTSAMYQISKILSSDARMRSRLESELGDQIAQRQFEMNRERLGIANDIISKQKESEKVKKTQNDELKAQEKLQKNTKLGVKDYFTFNSKKAREQKLMAEKARLEGIEDGKRTEQQRTQLGVLSNYASMSEKERRKAAKATSKSIVDGIKDEMKAIKVTHKGKIEAADDELKKAKEKKISDNAELKLSQAALANLTLKPRILEAVKNNATGVLSPLGKILGASGDIKMLFTDFKNPMNALNAATAASALSMQFLSKVAEVSVQRFKELEDTAEKFRKETGLTKDQSEKVTEYAKEINKEYAEFGVTLEESTKSVKVLADLFGTTEGISKNTIKDISLMSVNLGLAQEDAAGVLQTFMGISGMTEQSAMNVMKTTAVLTKGTKIPFSKVMHDVANASDDVLTSIGATPAKLIKAAAAARAMGLELNKVGSQQKRLLDYSSSITDELEASALLGRNITFMKARQLAFEGKSAESMRETLDVVKQMGNFNAMTPYQRAAVAKAAGMELKDLTKALAVDKARQSILNGKDQKAIDSLNRQDEMLKNLEDENTLTSEQLLKQRESVILEKQMQGMVTDIKNSFSAIGILFGEVFLPIIKTLGEWATFINNTIKDWSSGAKAFLGILVLVAASIPMILGGIAKYVIMNAAVSSAKIIADVAVAATESAAAVATANAAAAATPSTPAAAMAERASTVATDAAPSVSNKVTEAAAKTDKVGKGVNYGGGIKVFLRNFTDGLSYFGRPSVMKGYLGIALMGASLLPFIGAMYLFTQIDWAKAVDGITALAIVSTIAGVIGLSAPLLIKGAGALAILGVALLPLAITFAIVGKAAQEFSAGIVVARDAIVQILEKANPLNILAFGAAIAGMTYALAAAAPVAAIAGAGLLTMTLGLSSLAFAISIVAPNAEKFGKGMKQGASALKMLADIKFISLSSNMTQLNEFLKTSNEGMSGVISNLFGKDSITKIEQLSKISGGLAISADAIQKLVNSFSNFSQIGGFATAIDGIVLSFNKLTPATIEQLSKMSNNITPIAEAITKMISSFQNFGAVDSFAIAIDGLATSLSGLFGADDLSKIEKLSNISAGLAISAGAIQTLMTSMQNFSQIDSFAIAIDGLATSLSGLNTSISALDMNKLSDVAKSTSSTSTAASTPQTSNTPHTQFDTTRLETKIDELAKALYNRPIQLYLDSRQISSATAKASGS